jgi:hypothetical protein
MTKLSNMRTRHVRVGGALLALAVVLTLVIVPATGSYPIALKPAKKTLTFKSWPISFLAADGNRVAVVTSRPGPANYVNPICDHVVVWDVAKKKPKKSVIETGVCPGNATVNEMLGLAVAGTKVAWLSGIGDMSLGMGIVVANVNGSTSGFGPSASNGNGAEGIPDGSWLGNLVGKGNLIAFDYWNVCTAQTLSGGEDVGNATCTQPAPGANAVEFLTDQQLQVVAGKTSTTIARAPNQLLGDFAWGYGGETEMHLRAISVDGGRILVQHSDTELALYSANGSLLREIKAAASTTFGDTVLQGKQLLTAVGGNKLALYNASSGAFIRTIRVKGSEVKLRDLQSGVAVYLENHKIHVLRLSNGKSFALKVPGLVDAQLEPAGLYYAHNVAGVNGGRVVFVPYAKALKKLR